MNSAYTLYAADNTAVSTTKFIPSSLNMFYLNPTTDNVLSWEIPPALTANCNYRVLDFSGKEVKNGEATVINGKLQLNLKLPRGHYDLIFDAFNQQAGLMVLEPLPAPAEPFFGMDTAWSWLERNPANQAALIKVIKRYGITVCRERLAWGAIEKDNSYNAVRNLFAGEGIKLLDVHHDSPAAFNGGKGGMMVIPTETDKIFAAWTGIAANWKKVWKGNETWNEEDDKSFCGDLPADQYCTYHKTLAAAIVGEAPESLLLNGGFTSGVSVDYMEKTGHCGLLDWSDAVALHYYGPAEQTAGTIRKYQEWTTRHGRPGMPLWVTECGASWRKEGDIRPALPKAIFCAADLAMKIAEAKAEGVAMVFPFVLGWYALEENNNSLLDGTKSPLRALTAYFNLIRTLDRAEYAGTLKLPPPVKLTRVFKRGNEAIVMIYTGSPGEVNADFGAPLFHGADGRDLAPGKAGTIPAPDGLTYMLLPWTDIKAQVLTGATPKGSTEVAPYRHHAPVVIRFTPDKTNTFSSVEHGYTLMVNPEKDRLIPLNFTLWNFSPKEQLTTLKVPDAIPETQTLRIPANGHLQAAISLNSERLNAERPYMMNVRLETSSGELIDRTQLELSPAPELNSLLSSWPIRRNIDPTPQRVNSSCPAKGVMKITLDLGKIAADINLKTCNGAWSNWATVRLALKGINTQGITGMVFRETITGTGWAEILLELRNNDRFIVGGMPLTGMQHDIYLPFSGPQLKFFDSVNRAKGNREFKAEDITAIEFVVHSHSRLNTMKISDVTLTGPAGK